MLKKLLAALGTLALVAGLVALVAGPASAHSHSVTGDCKTVQVALDNYKPESNVTDPNHVTVWIDNQTTAVTDVAFTGAFSKTYPLTSGQASHTYRVKVFAWDDASGASEYTFDTGVVTVANCETTIVPAEVLPTPAYCTAAGTVGGGGYTIPAKQTGVIYQKLSGNTWITIDAGTYPLAVGQTVQIRAVAEAGYKLDKAHTWNICIKGVDSKTCVVPLPPKADYQNCTGTPGKATTASYTIPAATTGIYYTLQNSSTTLNPGPVQVTTFPSTVVVVAHAAAGYTIPTGTKISWQFDFAATPACLGTSIVVTPYPEYGACTATPGVSSDNYYTIYATPGAHFQVKIGTANFVDVLPGRKDLGQTKVDITILAIADPDFAISGQSSFPFSFAAASDCLKPVTPQADFSQAVCDVKKPGAVTLATYTLTAVEGVTYSVTIDNSGAVTKKSGTFDLPTGSRVVVTATADRGYSLKPWSGLDKTAASPGDCLAGVTAGTVTFLNAQCDVAHPGTAFSGTYTISAADHISYQVSVSSIQSGKYLPAPTGVAVNTQPGDVVTVLVVPDTGYKIDPAHPIVLADYTHTFTTPSNLCLKDATPVKPSTTAESCLPSGGEGGGLGQLGGARTADQISQGFITIPTTEGVQYFVNDEPVAGGPLNEAPGDYKVTAAAKTGYSLVVQDSTHPDGYPAGGWTVTVGSDQLCTHPLVDPSASHVDLGCFASGSYTLGNDLNDPAALTWTVNGSTVTIDRAPKTFTVSAPGTVTVVATANGPSYGLESDAQTVWTFDFTQSTTCDLKTLALTGSSPTGWLTLGYLMLISGLALLALRFVRRRDEKA